MTESNQDAIGENVASRRAVLLGVGALGAAGLLAACGGDTQPNGAAPMATGATTLPTSSPQSGASANAEPPVDPNAIKVADIRVGSGKFYADEKLIVTQPAAGTFKAFDATCTHQGCLVAEMVGDKLRCPCHQSMFSIADGSVVQGPATQPLRAKTATVNGATINVT